MFFKLEGQFLKQKHMAVLFQFHDQDWQEYSCRIILDQLELIQCSNEQNLIASHGDLSNSKKQRSTSRGTSPAMWIIVFTTIIELQTTMVVVSGLHNKKSLNFNILKQSGKATDLDLRSITCQQKVLRLEEITPIKSFNCFLVSNRFETNLVVGISDKQQPITSLYTNWWNVPCQSVEFC